VSRAACVAALLAMAIAACGADSPSVRATTPRPAPPAVTVPSEPAVPVKLVKGLYAPSGLAFDGTHLYFTDLIEFRAYGDEAIFQIARDGGSRKTIARTSSPLSLAVDENFVYWLSGLADKQTLRRVPKQGGTDTVIPADDLATFVFVDSNTLYVNANDDSLDYAPKSGGAWTRVDLRAFLFSYGEAFTGIRAATAHGGSLYVSLQSRRHIAKLALADLRSGRTGVHWTEIPSGGECCIDAIAAMGDDIYGADASSGEIIRFTGGQQIVVATGQKGVSQIVVTEDALYWLRIERATIADDSLYWMARDLSSGSIMWMPRPR
jgi:hypothetical protein